MEPEKSHRLFSVCEQCWLDSHTKWEPESMDENGTLMMGLVGVELPEIRDFGTVETCSMCGSLTIAGIYEMMPEGDVYFSGDIGQSEYSFEFSLGTDDENEDK